MNVTTLAKRINSNEGMVNMAKKKGTWYTFDFDLTMPDKLRTAVNDKQNLSFEKEHEIKDAHSHKIVSYLAWDRICAGMDRIYDTLDYINTMKLGARSNLRSAFDFFDFINNSAVVIDCIKTIGLIFGVNKSDIEKIEKSQKIFGDVLGVNGTDGQFFEYIRSVCVSHPINTTRRHPYLRDSALHCCPYVTWTNDAVGVLFGDGRDLSVRIYNSKRTGEIENIPLYVKKFEAYLKLWIAFIPKIIKAIKSYTNSVYDEYRARKMKQRADFNDEIEYLTYLREEDKKRFGTENDYLFSRCIDVFSVVPTHPSNVELFEKYKNAIRYAILFIHNSIQNMEVSGFEYTGIIGPNETESNLLQELLFPPIEGAEFEKCRYNLSKVSHLTDGDSYYDKLWARHLLDSMKELLNQYVLFTNNESDLETSVLVDVALYFNALQFKCSLNQSIPNEAIYRTHILEQAEWENLHM